jgi:outer membrane protein OmpA-like peptidoglycan-associated protein
MKCDATARSATAVAALGILAACSSTPAPNSTLDAARTSYNQAQNNPEVVQRAPLELQQAKQALERAEAAWQESGDPGDVDHYAYLASRNAQIAEASARMKSAQAQVANADATQAQAVATAADQRARQAESRADQLQQQLAALQSNKNEPGMVLTLGDILFDVNGATLKPGAYTSIDQIAAYLRQHPDRTATIQGFTDSTGSRPYNLQLSEARADAVRTELIRQGLDPSRVTSRGLGDDRPIANNETTAGRQLNRRVEIMISGPNGQFPATRS